MTSDDHRRTAARWQWGHSTALHAYASTGAVVPGVAGEIDDRLAFVERAAVDVGFDRVGEHERLRALLHHVEPVLATQRAREIGREYGQWDAGQWRHDALDGRPTAEALATARRVVQGIEGDDPAILALAPGSDDVASPAAIAARCGWPEPDVDDAAAHGRWDAALAGICDTYVTAFIEAFREDVELACDRQLAKVPFIRRAATTAGPEPDQPLTPRGWIAQPIIRWQGVESEIVYDPLRYEIVDVGSSQSTPVPSDAGWKMPEPGGSRAVWIKDRVATVRSTLDRLDNQVAGIEPVELARAEELPAPEIAL